MMKTNEFQHQQHASDTATGSNSFMNIRVFDM
jgi:hypothetical protein